MRLLYILLLAALLAPAAALAQSAATYRVTFESTWSASTHPDGFPPDPHYSGLVGATHNDAASLWAPGALASEGIERMAESGSKTELLAEVATLVDAGTAGMELSGGGIGVSPGSVELTFEIGEDHSLVSLVSMLAPSPDWFVGVHGLDLYEDGVWREEVVVPLAVYDAGTDSGTTYTAANDDTNPPAPITEITDPPFLVDDTVPAVGTFTFTLLTTTDAEAAPDGRAFALDPPAPNPATDRTTLTLRLDRPQPVRVEVFDLLGRRVGTVFTGDLAAGTHPLRLDTSRLPGGLYAVRAQGTEVQATRRLTVLNR